MLYNSRLTMHNYVHGYVHKLMHKPCITKGRYTPVYTRAYTQTHTHSYTQLSMMGVMHPFAQPRLLRCTESFARHPVCKTILKMSVLRNVRDIIKRRDLDPSQILVLRVGTQ